MNSLGNNSGEHISLEQGHIIPQDAFGVPRGSEMFDMGLLDPEEILGYNRGRYTGNVKKEVIETLTTIIDRDGETL